MNSGLQCLSNTKELTENFLKQKHIDDINKDNPLGSKGQLVEAYANLISRLHFNDDHYVTPWDF